jgi:hypothetical protein
MNCVYRSVASWNSFEPWLTRTENLSFDEIGSTAGSVPPEWHVGDTIALEGLLKRLFERKHKIRQLVEEFRESNREPFSLWTERTHLTLVGSYIDP